MRVWHERNRFFRLEFADSLTALNWILLFDTFYIGIANSCGLFESRPGRRRLARQLPNGTVENRTESRQIRN